MHITLIMDMCYDVGICLQMSAVGELNPVGVYRPAATSGSDGICLWPLGPVFLFRY